MVAGTVAGSTALAGTRPFESEPLAETSVLADIAWAMGHRFDP